MKDGDAPVRTIEGVALSDRSGRFDLRFRAGRIDAVESAAEGPVPQWLAMPAFVNAHAHPNRAFAASAQRPSSLDDAIAAARQERATATSELYRTRASRLFDRAIAHGTARMRAHTDVDPETGMRAIQGVVAAARDAGDALDVEIVAFASASADPAHPATRDLLVEAVEQGAQLLGAVPALYADPNESVAALLALAARLEVAVDLHLDEHLAPAVALVEQVATATVEHGLQGNVSISHACVLSVMDDGPRARIFERMAEARMTLISSPELNLYLQGRGQGSPRERGIAPLVQAVRAGVAVRLGTDNVRDWFFPFGDADLLETGYIAALGAHFDAPQELTAALCGGRRALFVGDAADVVLLPASSFDDALARRPAGRVLIRRGRDVHPRGP